MFNQSIRNRFYNYLVYYFFTVEQFIFVKYNEISDEKHIYIQHNYRLVRKITKKINKYTFVVVVDIFKE
jgi:hypothetical protein